MQALVLNRVDEPLELQDRPSPQPGVGEVRVRLMAAALNRRDFFITRGLYPGIQVPVVLGSDGAGWVEQIGSEVDPGWEGRQVIVNPGLDWGQNPGVQAEGFNILGMPQDGTFAQEIVVPVEQLHPKPAVLGWEEAAALPLCGVTAYRAAFTQGKCRPGQTVLVTGAGGGVATFALQFAVAAGAKVWVTSSSTKKIERAVELGAQGGFDYMADNWGKTCLQTAGAPHLIMDGAGGKGYETLIHLAAPGGCIVNYGATAGRPERLDLFKVFWKQLRVQGSTMGSSADFIAMLEWVEQHTIRPVIEEVFPLEAGNEALARMEMSPQFGKYVLTMA